MKLAAVCVAALALVGFAAATELQYAITANGASRDSNTANPTNFTFTISTNDINTYTNYWFIANIPAGQYGNDTTNGGARMSIRAVGPSNRPRAQQYPNATADGDGFYTNGTLVATIDPRYNKLYIGNQNTNLKFRVRSSGDFATTAFVSYNATLMAKANPTPPQEANGDFGHIGRWDGRTYTGSVPCCGARWQVPVLCNAHVGYYLSVNVSATSGTLLQSSLWEFGLNGARNQRMFDPAPTVDEQQPSLAVKTCDGFDDCSVVNTQLYWFEVQTPFDSPATATFSYTISLFPAANNPSTTGANSNRTTSSSTGLNAASTHAPSTLIAAFTLLFAALLAVFTH